MAKITLGLIIALLVALLVARNLPRGTRRTTESPAPSQRNQTEGNGDKAESGTTVVAEGLEIPWSLAFLPDGTALFTERPGRVRFMDRAGKVRDAPVARLAVNHEGEGGLLGITIHPDFDENDYVYLYSTYRSGNQTFNRVQRYRVDSDGPALGNPTTVIDRIPAGRFHNGGRIKFGPDDKLYVTTGDSEQSGLAQDRRSLAGKILRLEDDGGIPADNPFDGSPVYALGLRNPQGLAWEPGTDRLYATEHGPTANDELNLIEPGKNYGWPEVTGEGGRAGFEEPALTSGGQTWAPSGLAFYTGPNDEFKNNLFFATLRGNHLRRVEFNSRGRVASTEELLAGSFGRIRDVVSGPDGTLYLLTSNRDGRGAPAASDDRLIKVVF